QGIQPKGIDTDGRAIGTPGKVIKSMFPYYLEYTRLGGTKRDVALDPDDLTIRHLEEVLLDERKRAHLICEGVYCEYRSVLDQKRDLSAWHRHDPRDQLRKKQQTLIEELEAKLASAVDESSDAYMYQDPQETERELAAAKALLDDM